MDHIQRAMTASRWMAVAADNAGVGRISQADREAGDNVGQLLTEFVWNGMPESGPDFKSGPQIALCVAAQVRATGSGFALALAEWLEKWAGGQR